MRKTFLLIVALLLVSKVAFCGPVGNTINKALRTTDSQWVFTTETDFVMDSEHDPGQPTFREYNIEEAWFVNEKVAYIGFEKFTPYAKIGVGVIETEFKDTANTKYECESDTGILVGAGVEGVLGTYEEYGIDFFGNILFEYYTADIDEYKESNAKVNVSSDEMTFGKLQVALGMNKTFEMDNGALLIPYAGVEFQEMRMATEYTATAGTIAKAEIKSETDNPIGVFGGCNYNMSDTLSLGIEGRFVDETAVTGSVSIKF